MFALRVGYAPAKRPIRRAGYKTITELGYECHTKHSDNSSCPQCRVRAELLFEQVGDQIKEKFGALEKRDHKRYLIGLDNFLKKKVEQTRQSRTRTTKRIRALEKEKASVIDKKLAAIRDYQYDKGD